MSAKHILAYVAGKKYLSNHLKRSNFAVDKKSLLFTIQVSIFT